MRTIQTALGVRRTRKDDENTGAAHAAPATCEDSHTLPTLSANPNSFPTDDDVSELAEALARPEAAAMILPPGATVGVETRIEIEIGVGGRQHPKPISRATAVQLRSGLVFTPAVLLRLGLMDRFLRWKGPR